MGRHKTYDRDAVLERAMRLFWDKGYGATSTRDLATAMGVNVYSVYAEFESKQGLYRAALQRYDETVVTGHFGGLEAEGAGLDAIRDVLRFFGTAARDDNPMLGCFLANAVTEVAPTTDTSRELGRRYTNRLRCAFEHAMTGAVAKGELDERTPIAALASTLTTTLLGVFFLLRAGAEWQMMRDTTDLAWAQVEAFALRLPNPHASTEE